MTRKRALEAEVVRLAAELDRLHLDPDRPYFACPSIAECIGIRHRAHCWDLTRPDAAEAGDPRYIERAGL